MGIPQKKPHKWLTDARKKFFANNQKMQIKIMVSYHLRAFRMMTNHKVEKRFVET